MPTGSFGTSHLLSFGVDRDVSGSRITTVEPALISFFHSAAQNIQTGDGVAIKKVTNVFSKKILAKRALREIKLLQHFRGHRNVGRPASHLRRMSN